jgi:hypothetical protein
VKRHPNDEAGCDLDVILSVLVVATGVVSLFFEVATGSPIGYHERKSRLKYRHCERKLVVVEKRDSVWVLEYLGALFQHH